MAHLKKHYSIEIDATPQRVYEMIIGNKTYPIWVSAFSDGYCEGNWSKGSKMYFLGVGQDGVVAGIISTIEENIPKEFISIKHIGEIKGGVEDFDSDAVKAWLPCYENYRLTQIGNHTRWEVEMDVLDSYESYFDEHWPKAQLGLKKLVEESHLVVETTVNATLDQAWACWTEPDHITKWNFASEDWHCPAASNDLKVGGKYSAKMAAKDNSFSFDFNATYDEIVPNKLLAFTLEDGRRVKVVFEKNDDNHVKVTETFDMEFENGPELQQSGWQAIIDNYKKHVEG
jgi:uncharacterized protein YndB with AHSA1/START domain